MKIKRPTIDFQKIPTPMFKGHKDFVLLVEFKKKILATIECRSITIFETFKGRIKKLGKIWIKKVLSSNSFQIDPYFLDLDKRTWTSF